jgi:hypothetical protein
LGSRGACGSRRLRNRAADFESHDFPSTSFQEDILLAPARSNPNWINESNVLVELALAARSEGINAFRHFASGAGTTLTHGLGSELSTLAEGSGTFATALSAVRAEVHRQISSQAASGVIDCSLLYLPEASMPSISFGFWYSPTLKAVIGGTQGLEVHILELTVDPAKRKYKMKLRFTICDNFGVDKTDLRWYSAGMSALWVLQHERSGYKPFVNEIIIEPEFSDTF